MRDDLPRLLAPSSAAERHAQPRAYREGGVSGGGAVRRGRGRDERTRSTSGRLRVSFPDLSSFAPVRVKAVVVGRLALGRSGTLHGGRPSRSLGGRRSRRARERRWARCRRWQAAAATADPLVYRNGEGMRPDVAAAFDRMAAAAGARASPWSSTPASAPTPNRRRSSPPIPTRAGSRRPATRCIAARPSSTSGPNPPTAGSPPTPPASASSSATPGRPGTTASTAGPAPCSEAGDAGLAVARGGGDGASPGGAACPSFVPTRFRAPLLRAAAHWNVSAALLAAQLMAESNFNPFARLAGRGPGHRPVHPRHRGRLRPATIPSTRSRRSTPRPT